MKYRADIEILIRTFLLEKLGISDGEELASDSNLLADGSIDSVSFMRLISHLETTLEIKIPAKDMLPKNFMTIDAMTRYLSPTAQAPDS